MELLTKLKHDLPSRNNLIVSSERTCFFHSQEQVAMLLASLQIQQQQATPTPTPERPVSNGDKTPVAAATTPASPAVETTPS